MEKEKVDKEETEKTNDSDSHISKKEYVGLLGRLKNNNVVATIVGLVIIVLCIYVFIAFFSFFFTGAEDQSLLKEDNSSEYLSENIKNWTGLNGARISDFFINRTFGVPVFAILIYFVLFGLWLTDFNDSFGKKWYRQFIYCTFTLIWGSVFFGSFISGYEDTNLFLGGEHGYQINLFLRGYVGWVGVVLLLAFSLLLFSFYAVNGLMDRMKCSLKKSKSNIKSGNKENSLDVETEKTDDESNVENAAAEKEINNEINNEEYSVKKQTTELEESTEGKEGHGVSSNQERITSEKNEASEDTDTLNNEEETEGKEAEVGDTEKDEQSTDDIKFEINSTNGLSSEKIEEDSLSSEVVEGETEGSNVEKVEDGKVHQLFEKGEKESQNTSVKPKVEEQVEEGRKEIEFSIETSSNVQTEDTTKSDEKFASYDPTKELPGYHKPVLSLFSPYEVEQVVDIEEQNNNKNRIVEILKSFKVSITSIKATVGPTVTLYEITLAEGVRVKTIKGLADDIAISIAAIGIRIIAPIPGKETIGIEVPNSKAVTVPMAELLSSKVYKETKYELPMVMGKTITNEVFMLDLCKAPHLLVAGATGKGKSVGLNVIITSLIYKKHPSQLKFVLVDPKMVEFSMYAPLEKHFLAKLPDIGDAIITDVTKVVQTLNSVCVLMEQRYELLKEASVRQVTEYNQKFLSHQLIPTDEHPHQYMPYIVVIIDEFSDLIMQVGKDLENPIVRIAQKARAVGIHMILATQRPSANVVTGLIKANFPGRIAFKVSTLMDSRVILDAVGAERLIGRGDMLVKSDGDGLVRAQCAFVQTEEVERIARFVASQPSYETAYMLPVVDSPDGENGNSNESFSDKDTLFKEVAEFVVSTQQGSTSMIQRKFQIGFNRAGRIMDQLERAGIVSRQQGGKPRQVLVGDMAMLDSILQSY